MRPRGHIRVELQFVHVTANSEHRRSWPLSFALEYSRRGPLRRRRQAD